MSLGLALSYTATKLALRPATPHRSYGLYRAEVLAALANSALLLVLSGVLLVEAYGRLRHPSPLQSGTMLAVAVLGLVGNGISLWALHHGRDSSLNLRAAYLEILADTFGVLAVLVGAVIIRATGFVAVDPILSALLSIAIVPRTIKLVREALHVLLEGTPPGLTHDAVEAEMRAVPGVVGVHDLHIWLLTSNVPVLTAHVVTSGASGTPGGGPGCDDVLDKIVARLHEAFEIDHTTIQIEHESRESREESGF